MSAYAVYAPRRLSVAEEYIGNYVRRCRRGKDKSMELSAGNRKILLEALSSFESEVRERLQAIQQREMDLVNLLEKIKGLRRDLPPPPDAS